eukprot:scaffold63257_cov24-Cyclotella_meneghiniana.AAC.2
MKDNKMQQSTENEYAAVLLIHRKEEKSLSKDQLDTTINLMERQLNNVLNKVSKDVIGSVTGHTYNEDHYI